MGKRFLILGTVVGAAALIYACGGGTIKNIDGGVDSGNGDSTSGSDSGTHSDGAVNDTGTGNDSGSGDGGCAQFLGSCDGGCPTNSVCVTRTQPGGDTHECYPVPSNCTNPNVCQCIGTCVCGQNQCVPQQPSGVYCYGPVSRAEFKKDIDYVGDGERAALAEQILSTRAQPGQTDVDLYGYTSMLLATVQQQQRQLDELKQQVDALKRK